MWQEQKTNLPKRVDMKKFTTYQSFKEIPEDTMISILLKQEGAEEWTIVSYVRRNDIDAKVIYTDYGTYYYDKIKEIHVLD